MRHIFCQIMNSTAFCRFVERMVAKFLTIYQNEFTKQSNYSVSQKACFRTILTVNCSKDYYTSIDALIAEHEANGIVAHNSVRFVKWFQG